jgi:ankyrin repeat protein
MDEHIGDEDFFDLIWAVEVEKVRHFLKANPNLVCLRDHADRTPLHRAVQMGSYELCLLLISTGSDVKAKDMSGNTPLHIASELWDESPVLMHLLLSHGADLNKRNNHFMSPIMTAVWASNLAGFSYLLGAGAILHFKDRKRRGLVDIAQMVIDSIKGRRKCAVQRARIGAILRLLQCLEPASSGEAPRR